MKTIMKNFESYLKKVKLSQKIFIYLMPILVLGGAVFLLIAPVQDEELEMLTSQTNQLHRDIKRKMPRTIKRKIQQNQTALLSLKENLEADSDSLNYLYAKLSNLEISDFDEKKWALTLDNILKKSLLLKISIDHIRNNDSENKSTENNIIPKKYIEIVGRGSYESTLKYLHFIENTPFIVDIKNVKMEKIQNDEKPQNWIEFNINFTIYGVNI